MALKASGTEIRNFEVGKVPEAQVGMLRARGVRSAVSVRRAHLRATSNGGGTVELVERDASVDLKAVGTEIRDFEVGKLPEAQVGKLTEAQVGMLRARGVRSAVSVRRAHLRASPFRAPWGTVRQISSSGTNPWP